MQVSLETKILNGMGGLLRFLVAGFSVLVSSSSSSSSLVSSVLGQVCLFGLAKCGKYEDCAESGAISIMSSLVIVAMSDSSVSVIDISPCLSRMQLWYASMVSMSGS